MSNPFGNSPANRAHISLGSWDLRGIGCPPGGQDKLAIRMIGSSEGSCSHSPLVQCGRVATWSVLPGQRRTHGPSTQCNRRVGVALLAKRLEGQPPAKAMFSGRVSEPWRRAASDACSPATADHNSRSMSPVRRSIL